MGESMQAVVERAIDELKRQQFFSELDAGFAALAADEGAWGEELRERALWESTLGDSLDPDEGSVRGEGVVASADPRAR
jgi:hypothetical protein